MISSLAHNVIPIFCLYWRITASVGYHVPWTAEAFFVGRGFNFFNMLSLKEQYLHPLWQQKKYGIYNRDGFTCRACKKDCYELTAQLHCHHLYYKRDALLWEYDDDALVTVCKDCHETIHSELPKLSGIIAFKILSGEIDATDLTKN